METIEPLTNLLVLLTALSVVAERLTNLLKLRREELRVPRASEAAEKKREAQITTHAFLIGIFVALLVKANFFEILFHLERPWQTLGWVQLQGGRWVRTSATQNWGTFLYALGGCVLTGTALGFGSKFWHDVLGAIFELRGMARQHRMGGPAPTQHASIPSGVGTDNG